MAVVMRKANKVISDHVGVNVGVKSEEMSETNVGNTDALKLNERQQFIIYTIKSNPYVKVKQKSETLSVTQRTVERDLAVMQKAGIIRHEGSDKAGIWVVLERVEKV